MLQSMQALGGGTGDLHLRAAAQLKLGHKHGNNGYLMGFGIWKSGCGIKILNELPNTEGLIPGEFILVKEQNQWSLYFSKLSSSVVQRKQERKVELININIDSIPGLEEALSALPNENILKLSYAQRKEVEDILHATSLAQEQPEGTIGVIKNRSSSQNQFSVEKDYLFREYLNEKFEYHSAHTAQFIRELPLPILEKIIKNIMEQLELPVMSDLLSGSLIPGGLSGPYDHLIAEKGWIEMRAEYRERFIVDKAMARNNMPLLKKIIISAKKEGKEHSDIILKHAFFLAIRCGNVNAITLLLEQGVEVNSSDKGSLPLVDAVLFRHQDICMKLIENGADVNAKDSSGKTALLYAATAGNAELCVQLIECGADNRDVMSIILNHKDENFRKTVLDAIIRKRGGEQKRKDALVFTSPSTVHATIHELIKQRDIEGVKALLTSDKRFLEKPDDNDITPLQTAMVWGCHEIAQYLLEKGADPNKKNKHNGTALDYAFNENDFLLLLKYGAIWTENHHSDKNFSRAFDKFMELSPDHSKSNSSPKK
jgi:ankyrin repeat protein